MSLFQFHLYIAGSLHVSGPQAQPQESSHSCSHNHWFSVCTALVVCSVTRPEQYRHWTSGCVNSCVKSPEDGPVGPKHVEIRQYINKIEIVTSVGFYSICWKDTRYKRLKTAFALRYQKYETVAVETAAICRWVLNFLSCTCVHCITEFNVG